ncbi:MAG: ThuA domain-containing protein [Chloroflexi bacterium]|nr:MAG: ThuA domain-containing protein [Chloroflexota bacterium]
MALRLELARTLATLHHARPHPSRPTRSDVRYQALAFSRTTGSRHDSIPDAIAAAQALGAQAGFAVDATEDPSVFTDSGLSGYSVVIFLLTTGYVLMSGQRADNDDVGRSLPYAE